MILIGVPMPMAIGPIPMTDGHGSHTKISVGQPIIMAAGPRWLIMAGSGFSAAISTGARPGFHGEPAVTMSAGHRCLHAVLESFMRGSPLAAKWTSNSISEIGRASWRDRCERCEHGG